ncbi:MAG: alpha-amylase [Lachnospira sp.]|nr:alpha-amylase [Lachnospira sp.]
MAKELYFQKGDPSKLGITQCNGGYNFAFISEYDELELRILRLKTKELYCSIKLDEGFKIGNVFAVFVKGITLKEFIYAYYYNNTALLDCTACNMITTRDFMENSDEDSYYVYKDVSFDWEADKKPQIANKDMLIYKLHTRGFTKDNNSKVKAKGTYAGIIEKIPYMKELGITSIELYPVHNFEDIIFAKSRFAPCMAPGKNYWGYSSGHYYMPKPEYAATKGVNFVNEFKELVKQLHKNGMELILEMHFPQDVIPHIVIDAIRYWVMEYHIDGIHINCDNVILDLVKSDPILSDIKVLSTYFERERNIYSLKNDRLIDYNDEFLINARRFLKGDEDVLREFAKAFSNKSPRVNYVACQNSFTLMDTVSYDKKHNEQNGENNRDGQSYNYSWNCGEEGPSRKKKIQALRRKQIKNALSMVFLSKGIPLLMAGDEFGNSQQGNNNPYCIDGKLTWLDWKDLDKNKEIYSFAKAIIDFRKQYLQTMSDNMEISFHSQNAWNQNFENADRDIGIMYSDLQTGQYVYIAYNMHWEERKLALPNLKGRTWQIKLDTSAKADVLRDERRVVLEGRTLVVLVGESDEKVI